MESLFYYLKATKSTVKNLLSKPDTILYPADHVPLPDNYRGAPIILEPEKCLLCQKCVRICPTHALTIIDIDDETAQFEINLGRCCYCGECQDGCTFEAISLTQNINNATLDKSSLIETITIPKRAKKKNKK